MAAARRAPPVYVLNHYLLVGNGNGGEGWAEPNVNVGNGNLTGKAGEGWTDIEIVRREAYGCGDNMRQALNGLSLCVCLGDGDPLVTSTLGLRVSRDARIRFYTEIGLDNGKKMLATASIMMQEQGLLIMVLLLESNCRNLSCYLVYDRSDASLSMISWVLPESLEVLSMPVPKRTSADGAYELFFLACDERDDGRLPLASDDMDPPPFLCVFSPATTGTNPTSCAWEVKRTTRNWNVPASVVKRFSPDATFSFQGKGFWADLSLALIYCDDLHTDSAVDFGCIELPGECQLNLKEVLDCPPMQLTRTIGCVGKSICFVSIRRGERHADDSVTVWSLELPVGQGQGQWKNEARFPVKDLWRFDGFKEAGLPEAKVGYPLLTADGALCLVVTGQFLGYSYSDVSYVDHICTFDVRNKRLLWHGTVHDHKITETVAFPPGFFVQKKKHGSHKGKFGEPDFAARE